MYNGKFERDKADARQTVIRYLPIVFIVLISAIIVLLGYLLCLGSINAIRAMYVFFTENIGKFTVPKEAYIILAVIGLLTTFAIVIKKCYFSEWVNYYPADSADEKAGKGFETTDSTKSAKAPKMVRNSEKTVAKQPKVKSKGRVQRDVEDYDVSLNEVVWTNEEPPNRYGFKF